MGAGEERLPFSLRKGKPDASERQARGNSDALQCRRLREIEPTANGTAANRPTLNGTTANGKAANRPTLNGTTANGKAGGGTEIAASGRSGA